MVSMIRLVVCVVVFGGLWLAALGIVVSRVRGTLGSRKSETGCRMCLAPAIAYLGIVSLALPYALYVEPYWPQVERVTITSSKVHPARPIRIVHLSDLHSDPEVRLEDRLPAMIQELAPDVVVFTGDHVNSMAGVPVFRRCAHAIADKFPTYAVKGNWESWWFKGIDVFEGTGVVELDGSAMPVDIEGTRIWIAGVAVENEFLIESAIRPIPNNEYTVFLHHFPSMAGQLSTLGVDLHLAGDTHGGQLRLPLLGELVRISRQGIWEPVGLQKKGDMWLYVNRGIGMEGGKAPRVRLGCRPEVTLIEIS